MLAGVGGGLAKYFDIHPAVYRVGFVVLTLLGGAGVIIYVAAALVMPKEGDEDSFATRILKQRRDRPWPVIGLGLLAVAFASALSQATLWPHGDAWLILLVLGGAILWITRHSVPADADATVLATEDSHRIGRFFKGLTIAFATLLALLLIGLAAFASVFHVHFSNGVGERSYVVAGTDQPRTSYKLGVGKLTIDLREAELPSGETHIKARVDVGALHILVPPGVRLRVHADARFGELRVLGRKTDGHDVEQTLTQRGERVLVLDARAEVGEVHVTRTLR
jgi:phage shock protein PspC (stress-responsive transcriptional regulator)